jgi:hypothetical protein
MRALAGIGTSEKSANEGCTCSLGSPLLDGLIDVPPQPPTSRTARKEARRRGLLVLEGFPMRTIKALFFQPFQALAPHLRTAPHNAESI